MIDPITIRQDFPIFDAEKNLVYLDSSATSLKPRQVIEKEAEYYKKYTANIFRGIYRLSEKATEEYESVRQIVAQFIGARQPEEVVFVRNATEAINLVASAWGKKALTAKSTLITTIIEHHANFVPWLELAQTTGCEMKVIGLKDDGKLDEEELLKQVTEKTSLVAFTHVSNVLGTIHPVKELTSKIKQKNPKCVVLIDGAQAVPHLHVDVNDLGCDFYVFSSHKMLGPTGVGVLWGRYELLNNMPPYQFGGEMIEEVYWNRASYKKPPHRFEAGTPHIAGVIGLGAAIDFLNNLGMGNIRKHETEIIQYALEVLQKINGLKLYGPVDPLNRGGLVAFTIPHIHAHDIAQVLDSDNICIRTGHHCAMPLHQYLGIPASARASFYIYNTFKDIDQLVNGLKKAKKLFS